MFNSCNSNKIQVNFGAGITCKQFKVRNYINCISFSVSLSKNEQTTTRLFMQFTYTVAAEVAVVATPPAVPILVNSMTITMVNNVWTIHAGLVYTIQVHGMRFCWF